MGGGVSIDLIHEIDYMTYLFGFPKKDHYISGTFSDLEIDSDDLAVHLFEYPKMISRDAYIESLSRTKEGKRAQIIDININVF